MSDHRVFSLDSHEEVLATPWPVETSGRVLLSCDEMKVIRRARRRADLLLRVCHEFNSLDADRRRKVVEALTWMIHEGIIEIVKGVMEGIES